MNDSERVKIIKDKFDKLTELALQALEYGFAYRAKIRDLEERNRNLSHDLAMSAGQICGQSEKIRHLESENWQLKKTIEDQEERINVLIGGWGK